jgi:hypothetical protein
MTAFTIPAGATPNELLSTRGPGGAANDLLVSRNAVLDAGRAVAAEADRRARVAARDRPHVVEVYQDRCAELDADTASWSTLGVAVLAVLGTFAGGRHGLGECRHDRERYEREHERLTQRYDRAVERWERDCAARDERDHRTALATIERGARDIQEGARADLAPWRYPSPLARWDAPAEPRPPREPDPPSPVWALAVWLLAGGGGGAVAGMIVGTLLTQTFGPRSAPREIEMPHVVEQRLRTRLDWFGDIDESRVEAWRATWCELARADRAGDRASARLIRAVAREIPGGRVVGALLDDESGDVERKR